jgi:uncharacterized membrane protein
VFIGHLATGLAAKKLETKPSLATYLASASLPDLLFTALLWAGVESVQVEPGYTAVTPLRFPFYPYSHSLLAALLLSAAVFLGYWWLRRSVRAATIVGVLPLGHWLLDVVSHRPDVPIGLSGPVVGLGLWQSIAGTFAVEGSLFAAGIYLYQRATRPRDRVGRWAFVAFVVFLLLVYVPGPFGPPPPSVTAVAAVNSSLLLLLLWAGWFDRHRESRAS